MCRVVISTAFTAHSRETTEAALDGAPGHPAFLTIACYRSSRAVPEPNDSAHAELSQVFREVGGVEAPSDVRCSTRRTLPPAEIDDHNTPHAGRCQSKDELESQTQDDGTRHE